VHPALPDLASVLHPKIFSRTPARTSSSTPEENQNEEDPKKTLCPEEEKNARRSRPLLYRRFYHTFTPAMTKAAGFQYIHAYSDFDCYYQASSACNTIQLTAVKA